MRLPCATHSHVLGSHRRCPNGCTARKLGRHAACSVWHAENGTRQGCDEETKREGESSNGTGSPQETTILRSLLYFTIFASRISCSHTHRHTLTHTRIHSSVCLAACSWAAELAACGIALAVKADNTPGYCANSTASYLLNSGYNFSATSGSPPSPLAVWLLVNLCP